MARKSTARRTPGKPVASTGGKNTVSALRRRQEVFGVVIILLAILLSFAIYSFNHEDLPSSLRFAPKSTENVVKVHNLIGPVGVYMAGIFFYILGFATYMLPIILGLWGFYKYRGVMEMEYLARTTGGILLMLCMATVFALPWPGEATRSHPEAWERGGAIGLMLSEFLQGNLGSLGGYLTLVMLTVISLILFTDISVFKVASKGGELVEQGVTLATRKYTDWRVGRELARAAALEDEETEPIRIVEVPNAFDDQPPAELIPPVTPPPLPGELLDANLEMISAHGEYPVQHEEPTEETSSFDDSLARLFASASHKPITDECSPYTANPPTDLEPPFIPPFGTPHSDLVGTGFDPHAELTEIPGLELLDLPKGNSVADEGWLRETSNRLTAILSEYGRKAQVVKAGPPGPAVTRFEVDLGHGERISNILGLEEELALKLHVDKVRVAISGSSERGTLGIEVPNPIRSQVTLREMLEWMKPTGPEETNLKVALGRKQDGAPIYADLRTMPHLLIAGATGSGKSVCINVIIMSLLYRMSPHRVRMMLVDHKRVELGLYDGIPHLIDHVAMEPDHAASVLAWAITEMERRYKLLADHTVRNIEDFNKKARQGITNPAGEHEPDRPLLSENGELPYVVIIIDELGDLMQLKEARLIEERLTRLAQMARAVGLHLIVATQRPSVDVITGVIKANFPSRIAFRVTNKHDSRTILDRQGAEALLGKGDMLFLPVGASDPMRIQCCYVSTEEIEKTLEYFQMTRDIFPRPEPLYGIIDTYTSQSKSSDSEEGDYGDDDPLLEEATQIVIRQKEASISLLQRKLKIGYSRAGRLIDALERRGIVGPSEGSKVRKVLISQNPGFPTDPG